VTEDDTHSAAVVKEEKPVATAKSKKKATAKSKTKRGKGE